ncbi:MAG: hypothetical protein WBV73_16230 [Phormidium sp.]
MILLDVYDRGSYDFRIDYYQPVPPPKLSETDQRCSCAAADNLCSVRTNAVLGGVAGIQRLAEKLDTLDKKIRTYHTDLFRLR